MSDIKVASMSFRQDVQARSGTKPLMDCNLDYRDGRKAVLTVYLPWRDDGSYGPVVVADGRSPAVVGSEIAALVAEYAELLERGWVPRKV